MSAVIEVEHLAKLYRLGKIGAGTLNDDIKRIWANIRGKEDPFAKIAMINDRTQHSTNNEYVWALKDIDFQVNSGDVLGIVGRNGAGKSTLLKLLSRITAPTVGSIKINGRVASLLEVGTGFHPEMTGRENVYMNGTILGMRRHEITKKFDEIVDFAGVAKYIDTPVKRYSSGMMVRLGFAVAAFLEPEILIVDEVLAVGDAEFQRKALGKMHDVSAGMGRTVIFVSHNMSAMRRLCKTGLYLKNGSTIFAGSIDDTVAKYLAEKDSARSVVSGSIGGIKVLEVMFLDKSGQEVQSFATHDDVKIVMKCSASTDLSKVSFALGFNNQFETRVTSLWSSYLDQDFEVKQGEFVVNFEVKHMKLFPGEYYISTYVASRGYQIERIDNFRKISVSFIEKHGLVVEPQMGQGYYLEDFLVSID